MRKRFLIITSIFFLAGLFTLGLSISSEAVEPIVIGSINPLTGHSAVQGLDMKRGEEMALAEINAAGGIFGRPLKIIWEDTESTPRAGMDAVHKLVEINKVPLILGAYSSGISLPTGQWTNSKKVIQIAEASTSPKLRDIGPYFFDAMGLDEIMGLSLADFAVAEGCETFASITVNNPFGIGIEIWTEKGVRKHGKQWLEAVRYDERKTDYRAELERLFAKKPEAVFFTAYGTESKLILKQAYEMGLQPTKGWYADHMSMWTNEVIPETANGIKGLNPGPTSGDRLSEFKANFDKRYGKDAKRTVYGWYAYDATWLAALALGLAGPDNPDQLVKALHIVSKYYNGVTGDKTFDEDGMQKMDYYQKFVFKDGKLIPYGW